MRLHISTRKNFGFALVATVSMMVLLTLVAIAMLSLSTIEQRSSGGGANEADRMARANARMALMMALGELQEAAGPDQRVTATASILGSSSNLYAGDTTAEDGRKHWAGVWDSSSYNPANPDGKTFVRWLVSGGVDDAGDDLDSITAAGTEAAADDVTIFEGLDAASTVMVPKVEVSTASGNKSYYAYWVEDEGVKTDLVWNEITAASNSDVDEERAQTRRLSAMAAPNYWLTAFGGSGPFRDPSDGGGVPSISGVMGPNDNFSYDNMEKALGLSDIPLMAGGTAAHKDWLKANRHIMSVNNRGVLADVKKGGLRRDLTLAFEMDGDADISGSEQPTLFNQQDGEFVGGTDKYASAHLSPGMPVKERYLFRETRDTGGPFSDKIYLKTSQLDKRNPSVARGPTWWNLRDYYNLYKRLDKSGSNYRIKARAYYPDRTTIGYAHSDMLDTISTWADHRDTDYRNPHQGPFAGQWKYVFRPARPSYAPVLLGTTTLYSVTATNYDAATQTADVAITLDPIFYLWNPYNRELEVDNFLVHFETGMPGRIDVELTDTATSTVSTYNIDTWKLLCCNLTNYQNQNWHSWGMNYGFIINGVSGSESSPYVLAPGEVVAASPSSQTGQSYLGYDPLNNSSGIFMSSIDVAGYTYPWVDPAPWRTKQVRVSVAPGATSVNVGYYDPTGGGLNSARFFMDAGLGLSGTTAADLSTSDVIPGDQTQHTHMQLTAVRHEHIAPDSRIFDTAKDLNTILNVKQQFGLFTYLMKPAAWSGSGPNSAQIFSRFNPAPLVVNKDWWAAATPNMVFNFVADQNPNNLINNNGLNFSTSARNAFWGKSYDSSGSTSVPMSNIPSSPLLSLVDFSHANLGTMAEDPFHAVGNSWPSPVISPLAPYGTVNTGGGEQTHGTGMDMSWNINDALFDRYFLSGIVPEYDHNGSGGAYRETGSLNDTLERFYGIDPADPTQTVDPDTAQASPVMEPYIPPGKTPVEVVAELLETDLDEAANETPGYKKMAAYSMLKGGFNINCTDANAWARFLRGSNGDLDVKFTDGSTDSRTGYMGFPSSSSPTPTVGAGGRQTWSGWSRLALKGQINNMASQIANEVKARGPFMSVSDFVNRKVGGSTITTQHNKGAMQAAIDTMNLNALVYTSAGGINSDYAKHASLVPATTPNGNTAVGIPGSVTQADVLRVLAPRLTARTDTFLIRGYGEVRDDNGTPADLTDDTIIASATCEALVQRLPEYVDAETYPDYNEPWDEYDPDETNDTKNLNETNQKYGRRFEIQNFRWLHESEI